MKLPRRRQFLHLAAGAAALPAVSRLAWAQAYPTRPITLVMPYAAGGPGDTLARMVAQDMSRTFKQQVIVENIAGAGGTIGSGKVAIAKADGYTLLMNHIGQATSPALYPQLRYDSIKDFEPVGLVAEVPMAFVAKKDFPARSFADFLAYVQSNKDKLSYAHAGVGSASHLCGLLLFSAIKAEVRMVPYRGAGPAMNDLLGGQVDFMCDQTVNLISHVNAGLIKAYAVTVKDKVPTLPNLPPAGDAGLPGFDLNIWYAVFAPKTTPKPIIDKLVEGLQAAIKDANVKERLAGLGANTVSQDRAQPESLRAHLRQEIEKWGPIIKAAGIKGE